MRPVLKSDVIYAPGKVPTGYLDWLERQDPQIVFDAPVSCSVFGQLFEPGAFDDQEFYEGTGLRPAKDGTIPYLRYVIRKKGVVEVGINACGQCHTRVFADGTVLKGAQGDFPLGPIGAFLTRKSTAKY